MSLDREVLFAKKFIHSLLGEKILALQKARAAHFTADHYEIPQKDGEKISPDRRSGSVFHIMPSLLMDDAVVTHVEGYWKFSDSAVLRDKSGIRSRKGSDSKWTLSKIYKTNFPATQNWAVWRELTNGNLSSGS